MFRKTLALVLSILVFTPVDGIAASRPAWLTSQQGAALGLAYEDCLKGYAKSVSDQSPAAVLRDGLIGAVIGGAVGGPIGLSIGWFTLGAVKGTIDGARIAKLQRNMRRAHEARCQSQVKLATMELYTGADIHAAAQELQAYLRSGRWSKDGRR